jgi:hypothetical protein
MKKGFWNYTQPINYTVCLVKILPVENPVGHWQNAFIGEERQAVLIYHQDYEFLIDNSDGYGLKKIYAGGGPDSYSAHLSNYEILGPIPESEWNQPDEKRHRENQKKVDAWLEQQNGEEFKKIKALREAAKHLKFDI